jgi:N-acetylglucosaminyldiphosphoundecaprenol N-acetyl-beta-D-mannosaminyltransferase
MRPEKLKVLGVPVVCANYREACEWLRAVSAESRRFTVAAAATHLIAEANRDREYGMILKSFDAVFPDGMPTVWNLNLQGAGLRDRVYGPYLMRELIRTTPRPSKHYFFGGTEECLRALKEKLLILQPNLEIVGMFSPPYRKWSEEDETLFSKQIRDSGADFIWVALGGVKQERWIHANRHRYERGVFLAVGDAFELLAGRRPFAPDGMQRCGLTWLYRLWQEPGKLWKRYLIYNTLYLWYWFKEGIQKG